MDELKVKKERDCQLLENNSLGGLILVQNSNIAWMVME